MDDEFYDDYFRVSEKNDDKKSRPFLLFKNSIDGCDVYIPLRHKPQPNKRFTSWYVLIAKDATQNGDIVPRNPYAEMSKLIVAEKKYRKMIVVRNVPTLDLHAGGKSVIAAIPAITERLVTLNLNKSPICKQEGTVDFAVIVKKVLDYRIALKMATKGMRNTKDKECSDLLRQLSARHDQALFQFDRAYTRWCNAIKLGKKSLKFNLDINALTKARVSARSFLSLLDKVPATTLSVGAIILAPIMEFEKAIVGMENELDSVN